MEKPDKAQKKLKKRHDRRAVWVMRAGALLCLLGVGLGVWLTQTDWGRERMSRLAVSVIRRELGLQATLGEVRVDFSYFPPGVAVHATDIVLDDPVYGRFVEARELTIEPSLRAFLAGELDLETIRIDHPTIHLVVRDGEVRNLPRTRDTPEGETHLPFSAIEATSATVIIDAQPFADARIENMDLSVRVEAGRRVSLRADASGGQVVHALGTETLQRLLIDGEIDPDQEVELRRFVLRTSHVRLDVSNFHLPLPYDRTWAGEVSASGSC